MQVFIVRLLTRLMAFLAILGGFLLGMSSIAPSESTYALLLILVGTVIGWQGALWIMRREKELQATAPPKSGGKAVMAKDKPQKTPKGKHRL